MIECTRKCETTNAIVGCGPTVAIIGCGPSGVSFLHAVALRKQRMENRGDFVGALQLPIVTCFEPASEPGGVWRSERAWLATRMIEPYSGSITEGISSDGDDCSIEETSSDEEEISLNSYFSSNVTMDSASDEEEKYLNDRPHLLVEKGVNSVEPIPYSTTYMNDGQPKKAFEFFNYTFQDLLKYPSNNLSSKQYRLKYLLEHVEKKNPNIFDDSVRFNTKVKCVRYNEITKKFEITIRGIASEDEPSLKFDKCIWGAGENGIESVPRSRRKILRKQPGHERHTHACTAWSFLDLDDCIGGKNDEHIEVIAPAGSLGVVINTPLLGSPRVHAIKDTSFLADKVRIGDNLISVNGRDTIHMSAIKVSRLISSNAHKSGRTFVFVRPQVVKSEESFVGDI